MAYNSDGYIMIDFTEVDFRRTNQTIDGLYKRCVDVIGTNKFILVINANGRTPLPATCSFTNNQYVIDTCIYMFAISSNDNLFIRRNDVPASDIIDDSSISVDKTWSSNKIDMELDGKQNVLTAGDNIIINNDVISAKGIKSFTYTGTGTNPSEILFTEKPIIILSIFAPYQITNDIPIGIVYMDTCIVGLQKYVGTHYTASDNIGVSMAEVVSNVEYDDVNNKMIVTGNNSINALNRANITYTVYYI